MPIFPARDLESFCARLFVAAGAPPDIADMVADLLIGADLRGLESHGVMRSTRYVARVRDGSLNPAARPSVLRRHAANAIVDGGWGFGHVSARFGVDLAIALCAEHGQAGVALRHTHHIGRLGAYVETLARAGLVGMVLTGGGVRGGSVAPYGSRDRLLGTNPIAIAVPTPDGQPSLVLDFATSALAEGTVAVAQANQQSIPTGAVIDTAGRATTRAGAFYEGGALLPFGGHKGSALMLMIEIIATTLADSAPIALPEYQQGNPTLILAWSVEAFIPHAVFTAHVGALVERIRHSQPADGFSEVLVPGEIEARSMAKRLREGIPLSDGTWRELAALAQSLGVPVLETQSGPLKS
jgi:LDH2 family malate/lactate/ureidoglycolate dehydrogenase